MVIIQLVVTFLNELIKSYLFGFFHLYNIDNLLLYDKYMCLQLLLYQTLNYFSIYGMQTNLQIFAK